VGRMSDALHALAGRETKAAVPGADVVLGNLSTPTISTQQIDRAMDGAARLSSILAAALSWTARNFAEAPLVAMRDGEPDYEHPLSRAFARPTPWHSQTRFWQRFMMLLATDPRGAYIVAASDDTGEVGALWARGSRHVRPVLSPTEYIAGWEFVTHGHATPVDPAKFTIVRQSYASPEPNDEFYSLCPVEQVRKEVRTHVTASLWLDNILQNMGVSSGLIGIDHPALDAATAKSVQDEVNERMGGAHRGGTFSVLAGKVSVNEIGMSLDELDFGPLVDRVEVAVARAFGIPAELLQVLAAVGKGEGLNASAYRDKARIAYDNGIIPLWKDVAESVGTFIGPAYGLGPEDVAFDYSGIEALADDAKRKVDMAVAALPFLTLNEAREIAGYGPEPWGAINTQAAVYGRLAAADAPKASGEIETKTLAGYATFERKAASMEPDLQRRARRVFAAEAEAVKDAIAGVSGIDAIERAAQDAIDPRRWMDEFADAVLAAVAEGYDIARAMIVPSKARVSRGFGITDPAAVDAAVNRVAKLAGHVTQTTKDRIAELVAQGIEAGFAPDEVADAILSQGFGDAFTAQRAITIARTESLMALNEGGLIGAKNTADELGLTVRKAWETAGADARPLHLAAQAAGWQPLDSDFGVGAQFPGGFGIASEDINCFPAGTRVAAASVEGAYRRMYDGPIVTVVTLDGDTLTGTPNHPVLTDAGWKALGLVDEGDNLIHASVGEEVALGDPDVHDAPSGIEQVFETLAAVAVVRRERTGNMDFHGDATDGEVEIVRADSELKRSQYPSFGKKIADSDLSRADVLESGLSGEGALMHGFGGVMPAAPGDMSVADETGALGSAHLAHPDAHRSRASSSLNAHTDKTASDDAAGASVPGGDGLLGFPAKIRLANVAKVELGHYSGHVYNLQTASGTYIANNIVVHNCRCALVYEAT